MIKELLVNAHIGVTATVYAHIRLRLQHDAIGILSTALGSRETTKTGNSNSENLWPCTGPVR